jgi:hypothetical protein
MPDERSLLDRMMDFVDYHLGGTVVNRPPRKSRDGGDQSGYGSFIADGSSDSSGGFDDCGSAGDAGGGGDCGGGDGGGGGGD